MPRILIIEDDPDLAEIMALTLRAAGHEVLLAADGAAGLVALRRTPPDLAIIDIMLPDIVGLSLCERLREQGPPGAPPLPIILTSACDEHDTRPLALAAGADDFLAKPFSPYQLNLRVHALLGRPRAEPLAS